MKYSKSAIASLVAGILPLLGLMKGSIILVIPFLAIVFGIMALVTIPKKNQKGKWMAVTGIVLACLQILLVVYLAVAFSKIW